MADGGGYEANLEALKQHAGEVRAVGDAVHEAADAAGQAGAVLDKAFGLIGQEVAMLIEPWIEKAKDAINRAGDVGHGLGDKVNAAHDTYKDREDRHKAAFEKLQKDG